MPEIVFPDAGKRYVRVLRFLNCLDDNHNELSLVKLNAWAANFAAMMAAVAAGLGHTSEIRDGLAPLMTWLTQAHVTHHFDKRERSVARAREGAAQVTRDSQQQ